MSKEIDWLEEASIAFHESGAQYEADVRQEDWEAAWLARHGRDADGNEDTELMTQKEKLEHALACDAHTLKLVKVYYGSDTGLVSLATPPGVLLASTEDEKKLHVASRIPRFTISDMEAERRFGPEHFWGDIMSWLCENYDWEKGCIRGE